MYLFYLLGYFSTLNCRDAFDALVGEPVADCAQALPALGVRRAWLKLKERLEGKTPAYQARVGNLQIRFRKNEVFGKEYVDVQRALPPARLATAVPAKARLDRVDFGKEAARRPVKEAGAGGIEERRLIFDVERARLVERGSLQRAKEAAEVAKRAVEYRRRIAFVRA